MKVGLEHKLVRPKDVLFQELDGESVLMNVSSGYYYGLNESGHSMWRAATESDSVSAAAARVTKEFEAPAEQIAEDLIALMQELLDHGLVEIAD